MTNVVAHRGASGLVSFENTLDSFEKAIEVGSDMVEFDVRKTKDNVLVVFHDRIFADMPINLATYSELENEASVRGFHLPTFSEVLQLCHNRIFMDIEVKDHGYEKRLVHELHKYASVNEYWVKSFDDRVSFCVKEIDNRIQTGLLLGKAKAKFRRRMTELFPLRRLKACKADFVSPNFRLLHFGFLMRMRLYRYPVYVWTVNDEAMMKKLYDKKVDGIISDRQDLVRNVIFAEDSLGEE